MTLRRLPPSALSSTAALAIALAAFAAIAVDVFHGGPLAAVDPAATAWLAAHRHPVLTAFMRAVSDLHSTLGIDAMLAVVVALLLRRREWRPALALAACVQGAMLLNVALKLAFERHRPELAEPLVQLASYSFPSGHALASTVWWGCATALAGRFGGRTDARAVAAAGVVMVGLTCFSRVDLGAHFLSDVLAGFCEGAAWLAAWAAAAALRPRAGPGSPTCGP